MAERRIYLLSARKLSPETIAVAFAKTSRSPESFDEIAAGLSEDQSARFHEKWVVGYGHASVAEHAVLHLAMEGISRLAIECIESSRLASYTEKSTRYQKWQTDDFHVPGELDGSSIRAEYVRVCHSLFETYLEGLEPARRVIAERMPRQDDESEGAWDRRLRSRYVDACRFLLPAAAHANVGMTVNARVLENVLRKMLSHELIEVRTIGEQVKQVAQLEVPTLVKYADAVPYLVSERESLRRAAAEGSTPSTHAPDARTTDRVVDQHPGTCQLVQYDPQGENRVLAAALYRHSGGTLQDSLDRVMGMDEAQRAQLAAAVLGALAQHDTPIRELEFCTYTFDLVMDQGAYAEFKRHRMMTQTPQLLGTDLGYSTPRLLVDAGFQDRYDRAMDLAAGLHQALLPVSPDVAQYPVPNGFKRRVLAQFNLREAFAFCELRSAPNAHFSIRIVAEQVAREILRVHPLLAAYMRLPDETPQQVSEQYFAASRQSEQ